MTEFQLLDIRSKFHGKMIISYYTHRHSCACSKESDETEHSIHGTEASWKLKARPTACAVSHLTHLARENVTTNVTRGGRVYSYRVQATHTVHCVYSGLNNCQKSGDSLTGDGSGTQMTRSCRRQYVYVLPGWSKQTIEFMTSQWPGTVLCD